MFIRRQSVIRGIQTAGTCFGFVLMMTKAVLSAETSGASVLLPGLKQTLTLANPVSEKRSDVRVSRLIALYVREGDCVSPFLKPGPFRSKWDGFLNLNINDEFVFGAGGSGSVSVWINGERVLESSGPSLDTAKSASIAMKKGTNRIEVTYVSPRNGDSEFRLYWWNPQQPVEPLSPELFTHDSNDPALITGLQLRTGRQLFAELRCIRCHQPNSALGTRAMPELQYDAPSLTGVGNRLEQGWMAEWLLNPRSIRSDARMPVTLRGEPVTRSNDAADIAAFLSVQTQGTQGSPDKDLRSSDAIAEETGKGLFDMLGCATCHRFAGDPELKGADRLPLDHVKAKWKPEALAKFLRFPAEHFRWVRMPDFRLEEGEARSIAAFILSRCVGGSPKAVAGDPERGRELVVSKGCLSCHELADTKNQYMAPGLASLAVSSGPSGCLSAEIGVGEQPDYGLTPGQREALVGFVRLGIESLNDDALPDFASRQFANLRCGACHARDFQPDLWSSLVARGLTLGTALAENADEDLIDDFGDEPVAVEGAPAENNIHELRPPLTWAGEKLYADWMTQCISGELPYKPRAQLKARMPAFSAFAKDLAIGFVLDHGFSPIRPPKPPLNRELAGIGEKLIQMDKLGCASCHAVGEKGALSGPASEAINFRYTPLRLRRHYFERFVLDPKRVLPGTMMPQFVDETGQTPFTDFLEGNAARQFDAIWHFMRTLSE